MVQFAHGLFRKSVFRPIPKNTAMNDILALLFHRLAATVYLLYFVWAILVSFGVLSNIESQHDRIYSGIFALVVLLTAGASCLGATFWPLLARLELFTGASFVGLLFFYLGFALVDILNNPNPASDLRFANWVLLLSLLILPICRTIVVVLLLLRQAKEDDKPRGT